MYDANARFNLVGCNMRTTKIIALIITLLSLSACSSWVYRMNIAQGNFLEQKDVDKLRVEMSREQVIFVLGEPVARDAFNNDQWHYVYLFNAKRSTEQRKQLTLHFKQDKLEKISGDFDTPKSFNTPLEQ